MSGAIICGVDESQSAKGAARVARALSSVLRRGVIFVRIIEPGAPKAKVNAIAERLEHLSAGANEADYGAGWCVDLGHPADGLVAAAKEADASMIVVGSSGPDSSLLGSVSADVSRRAPCPVVVVPPGADDRVGGHGANGERGSEETEFAGGIARFAIGGGRTDFAGGIARFGLGSENGAGEFLVERPRG